MSELSYAQFVTLQVIGLLASSLSVIGSSLIVTSISRQQNKQKQLKKNTLHQLLLGLSVSDIMASFTVMAINLTNPKEHSNASPWALGNQGTCSASAFVYILATTAANFYNMFMSIHFHRMVTSSQKRSNLSQSTKQKDRWFRLVAHFVSVFIPLLFSIAGILTNSYSYEKYLGACYYVSYPYGCDTDPDVDCERGGLSRFIRLPRNAVICTIALTSIVFTVKLTLHVWDNIGRAGRHSFAKRISQHFMKTQKHPRPCERDANPSQPQQQPRESRKDKERKEVATQALWYALAYLNSCFFIVVFGIALNVTEASETPGNPGPYIMLIMLWFSQPIQGAINFLVFIRPRYNAWKFYFEKRQQRDPDDNPMPPFSIILKKAVLEQVPTTRQSGPGGERKLSPDKSKDTLPNSCQDQRSSVEPTTCPMTEAHISSTVVGCSFSQQPTIPEDVDFGDDDEVDDVEKDGIHEFKLDGSFDDDDS